MSLWLASVTDAWMQFEDADRRDLESVDYDFAAITRHRHEIQSDALQWQRLTD